MVNMERALSKCFRYKRFIRTVNGNEYERNRKEFESAFALINKQIH